MWGRDMGRALMRSTLLVRCMGCRMICIRYSCRLRGPVQPARALVGAVSEAEASRAEVLVAVVGARFELPLKFNTLTTESTGITEEPGDELICVGSFIPCQKPP